jgi:glycosyltransferase involved in cell wall biosynthesis
MVMSDVEFKNFHPGTDQQAAIVPKLKLDDLVRVSNNIHPKLTYMISTWNRRGQLLRTLECLARQKTKNFEVLLMDDGSTEDIHSAYEMFFPYLDIQYFHRERDEWRSCPSSSYKIMLPFAKGEVIAIMHPEMMLHPEATDYLFDAHFKKLNDVNYHVIVDPGVPDLFEEIIVNDSKETSGMLLMLSENAKPARFWVSLKSLFVSDTQYPLMDNVDWHSDIDNLKYLPNFMNIVGFAGKPNTWHEARKYYPWWFVASAKKDDPIWTDLPSFKGHAMIDMWFINYRKKYKMIDVVPTKTLCYHQAHVTSAYAPASESPDLKEK